MVTLPFYGCNKIELPRGVVFYEAGFFFNKCFHTLCHNYTINRRASQVGLNGVPFFISY